PLDRRFRHRRQGVDPRVGLHGTGDGRHRGARRFAARRHRGRPPRDDHGKHLRTAAAQPQTDAGARYAFTSFEYDLYHPAITDPVWGSEAEYQANDVKCSYHWFEALVGVDAKIYGPIHMGWSLRYRGRLSYKDGEPGKSWYVPGFGKGGSSAIGGTFNISIDI
ncbi:MAG: DUF6048 family protein, partial [Prevotella sp.]